MAIWIGIPQGSLHRRYRRYRTPLALNHPAQHLRDSLQRDTLRRIAAAISDTAAAQRMQQTKAKLFDRLRPTA